HQTIVMLFPLLERGGVSAPSRKVGRPMHFASSGKLLREILRPQVQLQGNTRAHGDWGGALHRHRWATYQPCRRSVERRSGYVIMTNGVSGSRDHEESDPW